MEARGLAVAGSCCKAHDAAQTRRLKTQKPGTWPGFSLQLEACRLRLPYFTSTARLSAIFLFQIAGPVMCTDSPLVSTATVTGMSLTSNS